MTTDSETLLLVDLGAIYWQAWHTSNREDEPDAPAEAALFRVRAWAERYTVAICVDDPAGTFRHELYPPYKATRTEKPEGASAQLRRTIEVLRREGFPIWEWPNHEADDVIASAALAAASEPGQRVLIASQDKDLMALVADPLIGVLNTRTGEEMWDAEVIAKYGVRPRQIPDYLALIGDTSDNVPGVKGIGEKRAAALLGHYGTLTEILRAAAEPEEQHPEIKPAMRTGLLAATETIALARRLVTLVDVLPIPWREAFEPAQVCGTVEVVEVPASPPAPEPMPAPRREEAKEVEVKTEKEGNGQMKIGKFAVLTGRSKLPGRFVLYGPGGWGKSTLACSAPAPLVVCIEDGIGEIDAPRMAFDDTGRITPRTLDEVKEALVAIRDSEVGDRRTLVIDGVSRLDTLVQEHVVKSNAKWKSIQDPGFGKGEAEVLATWAPILGLLEEIRKRHSMRIVLTAHEQILNFKNPEGAEFGRYDIAVTKHNKGDVAAAIFNWAEVVGFCRFETLTHEVNKRTIALSEQGSRVMHLSRTGAYQAKCRLGNVETVELSTPEGQPRTWAEVFGEMEDKAPERLREQIKATAAEVDAATSAKAIAYLDKVGDDVGALSRCLENLKMKKQAQQEAA